MGVGILAKKGFTIVELLIVIVVIAILAAITVVAYNGVTQQAQASKMLVSFDAWEKAVRMYYELHGEYPVPGGLSSYGGCLGSDFSAKGDFQAGECILVNGSNVHGYHENADLNAMLGENINISKAEFPYRRISFGGMDLQQRGILYFATNASADGDKQAQIMYYIAKDDKCGRGDKFFDSESGFGFCQVTLRAPL